MFELFANPANMIIGGALISSPIIIHLINRMRFKRIRWAAMEFLLKSQKRNRRRLIIEQLILLALRCFLIFLAVMLVTRYIGSYPLSQDGTLTTPSSWVTNLQVRRAMTPRIAVINLLLSLTSPSSALMPASTTWQVT